jgi:hypothetical protein
LAAAEAGAGGAPGTEQFLETGSLSASVFLGFPKISLKRALCSSSDRAGLKILDQSIVSEGIVALL